VSEPHTTQHPAQSGGLPGVIATTLPLAIVVVWLVWLAKPWKRSNLPRARVIEPPRDNEEP
jgi:hypothetical protein